MDKQVETQNMNPEDMHLQLSALPETPVLTPISFSERAFIFDKILSENIEYRYINGSCESRAHYISLLLQKYGFTVGKIWNFAPAKYTLISNELFSIADPFGITDILTWGYHVAPFVRAYDEKGEIETLIIDQSFSSHSFLKLDDWLGKMNCPRAIFILTEVESYLFNSLDGLIVFDDKLDPVTSQPVPTTLPSIITGYFWRLSPGDDFVQKGLAVNDLALEIVNKKNQFNKKENLHLGTILQNIDEVIKFIDMPKPAELRISTYNQLIQFYQKRYQHWGQKLANIIG
jgi:Glutaminase